MRLDPAGAMLLVALVAADVFSWVTLLSFRHAADARIYFLGIPHGESSLVMMNSGIKILIDGGADGAVAKNLEKLIPSDDHYIDLAVISRPDIKTIGGLESVLEHYEIGAFLYNGRSPSPGSAQVWKALLFELQKKKIPLITVMAGEKIILGDAEMSVLSPDKDFAASPASSDAGLLLAIRAKQWKALFTGGIGANIENFLARHVPDIQADILQFSPESPFFGAPRSRIVVFSGKPMKDALTQASSSANIRLFRTDIMGTVSVGYDILKEIPL